MLDAGIITSLQNIKFFVYETSCVVLMLYIDKEGLLGLLSITCICVTTAKK